MTKSTRTYNRRGSKRLRTGKYHDKYKIVLKPVEYKKQLAEWNNKDKYEDGPLITFYANVWERVCIFPLPKGSKVQTQGIVPAVYAEVYLNVHSGHGQYNELPLAVYTTKNGWNNDPASFKSTWQETKPEHYEWKKEVETLMQESL